LPGVPYANPDMDSASALPAATTASHRRWNRWDIQFSPYV
jgi:hypothetical protein